MFAFLTYGLAICFSAVLPLAILSLRWTVRQQRRSVILDLQKMFDLGEPHGHEEKIVPSFEFVKYKYFEHEPGATPVRTAAPNPGVTEGPPADTSPSTAAFLVCSVPLVLLVFAFGVLAISVVLAQVLPPGAGVWGMPRFRHIVGPPLSAGEQAVLWVFIVAFLGGYLFAVRGLLRAVNNFDLTPASFISAALHLLVGVVTAVVIVVGGLNGGGGVKILAAASIVAAFLIGFIPEFGLRTLYRASQLWLFKREDESVYRSFQATPVEVIDGIDTEIRSRLADFNIFTVQNLATANPIMLFVETPYGIYQSIDWVAQAQLCAAVGPKVVLRLWTLGIRTIFDLEKAVLVPGYTTEPLRQAVGQALLEDVAAPMLSRLRLAGGEPADIDDRTIIALVENKLDDLHVHRLRQITNRIEGRLGAENKRNARCFYGPWWPANDQGKRRAAA